MPRVLIACEFSGVVREAFRAQGCDAWSCDILESEIPGQHYQCDVRKVIDRHWDLIVAHPPCQHLASSGARWFEEKRADGRQSSAIHFFLWLAYSDCPRVAIENPVGIMSTVYRKPDQIVQPWMFGHGETKATCLWLKGLPPLQPTNIVSGREARIHNMPPSQTRARERSRTYSGIAKAMSIQWGFSPVE